MKNEGFFLPDYPTEKEPEIIPGGVIDKENSQKCAGIISDTVPEEAHKKGACFAEEIAGNIITSFEKENDKMVHVTTFVIINGVIYMSYYANNQTSNEDPKHQTARLAFCPLDDPNSKTFIDLQGPGEICGGKVVNLVYDTIIMTSDNETLYLMWTASLDGKYYRLYRTYTISTGALGPVSINRFKAGGVVCDFSFSGIQTALTENGIGYKSMYSDIGIMQKLSYRVENGEKYYYSGAYSGDFNFIIKSKDFITWEYVAQPDFINQSKWENAAYIIGDKCYYFSRQQDESPFGFLTYYDLVKEKWAVPVLIADCQSRSDFIVYKGGLYLFYAPVNREHIGVVRVDLDDLKNSKVIFQAAMKSSCFYPYIQHGKGGLPCTDDAPGDFYFSYTENRIKIPLARFKPENYLG